jgi:hypothetical protein
MMASGVRKKGGQINRGGSRIFGSLFYEALSVTRLYSADDRVISE